MKTPWYPGTLNPARPGWYECHYANTAKDQESGAIVMRLWDGERWWQPCEDGRILAASFGMRFDRWRGMTTPNAALTERGAEVVEKTTGVSPRPVEGRS